ncbi:MAG TPA: HK97 family phage prohead protease [Urbifossiella sp.]|nr:HK97 family phage prohead protease [Urbifossiella sp.]
MPPEQPQTREYCAEQVRGVDRDRRTIEVVFSDYSLDTYGTRFDQRGWDFSRFKKNPVILACHNDRKFVIARSLPETIRVVGQESRMTIQFPGEGKHPEADIAFNLYADGFMRGVSVGFSATAWEDVDEAGEDGTRTRVRIFRKMRLDEVSLVAIPSNENALAVRCARMGVDPEVIRRRAAELEEVLSHAPAPGEGHAPEDVEKWRCYFEQKQPCNREATRFLERFFKARGVTQPAEELAAWRTMNEMQEGEAAAPASGPAAEEPAPPPAAGPAKEKEPPPPPAPPAPEAPVPERKASVQLTASVLQQLPKLIAETAGRAAVEALQRGVPRKDVGKTVAAAVDALKTALRNS